MGGLRSRQRERQAARGVTAVPAVMLSSRLRLPDGIEGQGELPGSKRGAAGRRLREAGVVAGKFT